MRKNMLAFFLIGMAIFTIGCSNDTKIDIHYGTGYIEYEGEQYALNLSTVMTSSIVGGLYQHSVIFTNTNNGNVAFSFSVKDDNSQVVAGNYTTTLNGDYTAHFSISSDIGDYLAGTMSITVSGGKYTFNFEGTTIDENTEIKTVIFTYTGKMN